MEYSNKAEVSVVLNGKAKKYESNIVDSILEKGQISIIKSQAYEVLLPGQEQTYTIVITNGFLINGILGHFTDALPVGMTYVADSFTFDGTQATPTITNNILTYNFGNWIAGGIHTISFRTKVSG